MRALIMAGGSGSRLSLGEKPLIQVRGRPMIFWIARAFHAAGCEPVIATSPKTTMTANWCRANGLPLVQTDGTGFVEDMVQAVQLLEEKKPLFVSVSDIPGITAGDIITILRAYHGCGKDALSAWIPANRVASPAYCATVNGIEACPAGINILCGVRIDEVQDEFQLLLDEPGLAINVNTREDLARAETFLSTDNTGR